MLMNCWIYKIYVQSKTMNYHTVPTLIGPLLLLNNPGIFVTLTILVF